MFKVIFFLSLSISSWALDLQGLQLAMYCKQRLKQECTPQIKEALNHIKLSCEIEVQGLKCDQLQKEHPEWAPLMRKCDLESLCRQNEEQVRDESMACLRGYKNAMVDLGVSVKDMAVGLADFVEDSWQSFKTNIKKRNEFIRECNKSIACKRDLVKDDHRYANATDEQLQKMPASFLYVQAQDMRAYKASLDRARMSSLPRPNPREVEDVQLNSEQKIKLSHLMDMVADKVKEQYTRYSCYHPVAQAELKCYAIGNVIDPTLLAGYYVKGARAAVAVGRLSKADKAAEVAKAGEVAQGMRSLKAAGATFKNRAELTKAYLEFSPTTVAQNEKWIALAEKGKDAKAMFFDVENSQIKYLNDTLKDKNLVTSLTNFHKDILAKKMESLEKEFPGLHIEKYSDFKSQRFAFSGKVPPDLEKRLQKIFKDANVEFDDYLREHNIVRAADASGDWFRGGVGATADQANLAARYSRQVSTNEVQSFAKQDLQKSMNQKLQTVEADRRELRGHFENTSVIEGSTLHPDAFDIVRKAKGDSAIVALELQNRFGLQEVSKKSVQSLQRYVKDADDFSPGLYIAKRENAHLNEAVHGGLSADIIGLGGANLKGTAEALANAPSIDKALEATRLAEKAVTKNFIEQKKVFEQVVAKAVDPGKLKTICSGDDCVSVATAPLSEKDKVRILKGLSETKYSGSYRLAYVSEGVKDIESRNALANHGEAIEKVLRKSLSSKMEPRKLKGLTFGVDMRTQELNTGSVKLLMGEADGVKLSASERSLIQAKFEEAVKALNYEMLQAGKKADYSPVK